MKLEQLKLLEQRRVSFDLRNPKSVDRLAKAIGERGFPEHFNFTMHLDHLRPIAAETVDVTFELTDKKVNDHLGYHVVTFLYEFDKKSEDKLNALLKKVEDEHGEDSDEYDTLSEELKNRELEVHAELGPEGYSKIHGKAS